MPYDSIYKRQQSDKRGFNIPESLQVGKQIDEMFSSFRKEALLSQKDKERIEKL